MNEDTQDLETPTEWFSFCDNEEVVPLGVCANFDEAYDKAPGLTHWLFTRQSLIDFVQKAQKELK